MWCCCTLHCFSLRESIMNRSHNKVILSYQLILLILFVLIFSVGFADASMTGTHNLLGGKSFAPLSEAHYFFEEDSEHKASTNPYLDCVIKNYCTPDKYIQTYLFKSLLKITSIEAPVLPSNEELIVRIQTNLQNAIIITPSPPPRF